MILIFDIGKTNKKCFVFDEDYHIVFEKTTTLPETIDEDGYPCEDLNLLTAWVLDTWQTLLDNPHLNISAANVTTYGASLVCVDEDRKPVLPLYNYLKPYPDALLRQFLDTYGGAEKLMQETASPLLGSLNSGLQLYRIKHHNPSDFQRIKSALHLPQYVASLLHGRFYSDISSIGCHTMLWHFEQNRYHHWIEAEGMGHLFREIIPQHIAVRTDTWRSIRVGIGMHDSSAALVPYLSSFPATNRLSFTIPFVLISTGTWCISLNPFNSWPLTIEELQQDCLCYISPEGRRVKAARYFGGQEHEQAVQRIAAEHGVTAGFYKKASLAPTSPAESAYLDFMRQFVEKQAVSTQLVVGQYPAERIFVDGGFAKNEIYMTLLARAFPHTEVFAAEMAQATALGAALPLHHYWNRTPLPENMISLKKY